MAREPALLGWKSFVLLLCVALGIGALYRFTDMGKKPMHTDEAILALKTQDFWENSFFQYDKSDYHGPFLHHATRAMGTVRGFAPDDLNERRVRVIAGVFGFALILLPLFFLDAVGRTGAAMASLLIAASPMMNYFSRYYIMEMPFVFQGGLLLACLWRWSQSKNWLWMVLGGLSLGFMHATKETFILNVGAIVCGMIAVWITGQSFVRQNTNYGFATKRANGRRNKSGIFWFIISAVAASVWMFSNGFKDWQGVVDSVMTYQSYFERSGGSGHEKPWYYYLVTLFWKKDGFLWTEAAAGGLAVLGMISLGFDRKLASHERAAYVFGSIYTLALLTVYSLIPYKTPWSILSVYFTLALLAGAGARWIFRLVTGSISKGLLVALMTMAIYHLCHQTNRATDFSYPGETRYAVTERMPFAYAHTSQNLLELVTFVKKLSTLHPDGVVMPVQVINSDQGWPLPWYWRNMTHVGYQGELPAKLNANVAVVVVDAPLDAKVRELLKAAGAGEYESTLYRQRPGVPLSVLVKKDLWDRYMRVVDKEDDDADKESESVKKESEPTPISTPVPLEEPVTPPSTTPSPNTESTGSTTDPITLPVPVAEAVEDAESTSTTEAAASVSMPDAPAELPEQPKPEDAATESVPSTSPIAPLPQR